MLYQTLSKVPTVIIADHRRTVGSLYYQNLLSLLGASPSVFSPRTSLIAKRSASPFILASLVRFPSLRHIRMVYCSANGSRSHTKIAQLLNLDPMRVRQALSYLRLQGAIDLYDEAGHMAHLYTPALEQGVLTLLHEHEYALTDQFLARLYAHNAHLRILYSCADGEQHQRLFFHRFLFLLTLFQNRRQLLQELEYIGIWCRPYQLTNQDYLDIGEIFFRLMKEYSGEKWSASFAESLRNMYLFCSDVVRYFS